MRALLVTTYVHTIQIADRQGGTTTEKRTSERRKYRACIVATTTEATARAYAENKVRLEAEIAEWRAKLEARKAVWERKGRRRWFCVEAGEGFA